MGEVWLAEQETPRRKVAVKLIRRGRDSREVIARAVATAFTAMGLPDPGYDRVRHIVGLSLDEACRRLASLG